MQAILLFYSYFLQIQAYQLSNNYIIRWPWILPLSFRIFSLFIILHNCNYRPQQHVDNICYCLLHLQTYRLALSPSAMEAVGCEIASIFLPVPNKQWLAWWLSNVQLLQTVRGRRAWSTMYCHVKCATTYILWDVFSVSTLFSYVFVNWILWTPAWSSSR